MKPENQAWTSRSGKRGARSEERGAPPAAPWRMAPRHRGRGRWARGPRPARSRDRPPPPRPGPPNPKSPSATLARTFLVYGDEGCPARAAGGREAGRTSTAEEGAPRRPPLPLRRRPSVRGEPTRPCDGTGGSSGAGRLEPERRVRPGRETRGQLTTYKRVWGPRG